MEGLPKGYVCFRRHGPRIGVYVACKEYTGGVWCWEFSHSIYETLEEAKKNLRTRPDFEVLPDILDKEQMECIIKTARAFDTKEKK